MGFEAPETVYKLDFSETQYAGLEVEVRAITIEEMLHLQELIDGPDTPEGMRALFREFARFLVSWNVTKGGKPVPATYEGIAGLEQEFVTAIILAWQANTMQAPPPLPGTSSSGGTSPEVAATLAASSVSLPNS